MLETWRHLLTTLIESSQIITYATSSQNEMIPLILVEKIECRFKDNELENDQQLWPTKAVTGLRKVSPCKNGVEANLKHAV